MKSYYLSITCIILTTGLCAEAVGQKRTGRTTGNNKPDPTVPKRTDRAIPESERVKVITKTEFVKVAVRENKGYLSVVAVPTAVVTLTPLTANQKRPPAAIKETVKDEDGSLNLINLLPGKYKIVIEHPDYNPYSATIQVDPARPDTFVADKKMVSKYGAISIGGAPANAKIFLDEAPVAPSRMTVENQNAVIPKVPVGKHILRITKTGYAEFKREIEVTPGKQIFVPAQLDLARVTLNLRSEPGAKVYVGNEEKATIPSDGDVAISLAPGRHTMQVSKEGYQEWRKELTFSLENNPVIERANLIPIPNSTEGDWQPSLGARKWRPQPAAWRFDATGAHIKGDQLVLFHTDANRDFNTYRDFKLEFDVVFTNGKGVAWVARAKDRNNYYLFEISGPQSGKPVFNFYVCQDGKLELKDSRLIVEKMDRPGDSFHIIFETSGGRFDTRMTSNIAPSANPHLIGISQDNSFSYGGVGFRGKDQSEALLQTFFIIPLSR
ncbi:MAG: PEGA domain-containing protein [Blastocatellia bacterium]